MVLPSSKAGHEKPCLLGRWTALLKQTEGSAVRIEIPVILQICTGRPASKCCGFDQSSVIASIANDIIIG